MDYMVEISLLTKSGNRVLNKKLSNIKWFNYMVVDRFMSNFEVFSV